MTPKIKEIWKDIPEYEGLYQASSLGRIRSLMFRYSNGKYKPRENPHILKQSLMTNGYLRIALRKNGQTKHYCVHRLILTTFSGRSGVCCAHMDGTRDNNNASNLKWVTYKENSAHMIAHGTKQYGEKTSSAKLKEYEVHEIMRMKKIGYKQTEIAKKYNITPAHVSYLINGKSWSWLKLKDKYFNE